MLINGERLLAVGERGTILFSLDQGRSRSRRHWPHSAGDADRRRGAE